MTTVDVTPYTTLRAFVHLGFQEDCSLDFRVTLPRVKDEARLVVEAVGCYNRFRPEAAWAIIDGWWEHLMAVDLAREGSPVLSFRFPWTERQLLVNTDGIRWPLYSWGETRLNATVIDQWVQCLRRELEDEHADEIRYDPNARVLMARWE